MPTTASLVEVDTVDHGGKGRGDAECALHPERRKRTRVSVHWPLLLRREGASEDIETMTENLSSSGFYCFSPKPVTIGERLRCRLTAPSYDPKGDRREIELDCRAMVLRVEAAADGSFGVACRIEDYRLAS